MSNGIGRRLRKFETGVLGDKTILGPARRRWHYFKLVYGINIELYTCNFLIRSNDKTEKILETNFWSNWSNNPMDPC